MSASTRSEGPGSGQTATQGVLSRGLVVFMASAVGMIVANTYYIQPLLAEVGRSFALDVTGAGHIAMITQVGTAIGMLCLVPLGDTKERRSLIVLLLGLAALSLLGVACARGGLWMLVASFAVGLTGATVHLIVPYAAHLAAEHERGKVVGSVLSGLLLGILLARTVSGVIGAEFGWRVVYWGAAALMIALAGFTWWLLPPSTPTLKISYVQLMRSLWGLMRRYPQLRESSLVGSLLFASFSAFWTTLVFLLEGPPFHQGAAVAGLFGLIGAVGAAGAPLFGRLSDRYGPRLTIVWSIVVTMLAFVILWLAKAMLLGLIVGVILMDMGVQAGHVGNQTRIYSLDHAARSRLNTVYMFTYFVGGASGSLIASYLWQEAHWAGVCAFSLSCLAAALGGMGYYRRRR